MSSHDTATSQNSYSSISRRHLFAYTALAGLGLTATSNSASAAPSNSLLIDYSMRQIPAPYIRAAGYAGVVNYVSRSRPGSSFGAKPITAPYAATLTANGLVIVSAYQYGKTGSSTPADFTRGFLGGVADASTAWQLHVAAGGGQNAPIYFCIDDDINQATWTQFALPWFQGINSVLGVQRTGIYGGINTCYWAARDGVIGVSSIPGYRWAWQTRSWSHGKIFPAAVLYQRIVNTVRTPGPRIGGVPIDVSDVRASDCGQWNLHP